MLAQTWTVVISLFLVPLLSIAQEMFSFNTETFMHMKDLQKIEILKKTDFSLSSSISNTVGYFTVRWDDEKPLVVAAFCEAMGRAKAQQAITLLVRHIDFRYIEDTDAERPRAILEGHVALEALVQIGLPAMAPASQHIIARLSKSQDKHDIYFLCEALSYLVKKSMGQKEAREYVRELINEQKDTNIRYLLQTVEGKL